MILSDTAVMVDVTPMTNSGSGIYSYAWSVPQSSGTYRILMNCTSSGLLNSSVGGALYVSPRSFEKTVATGVSKYSTQYSEDKYGTAWWSEWVGVGSLLVGVVVLGTGVYLAHRIGAI
jgi:hypothetical protein